MTAVIYDQPTQGEDLAYVNKEYQGTIRPHPELKVLLDEEERVVSSQADLAVILLDKPVGDELRPMMLGEAEVGSNEVIVMVGYGDDEASGGLQGKRRINRSRTLKAVGPDGGRILLEQPEPQADTGDSGGPCLREMGQGPVLVGISSRRLGQEPACTNTYRYRVWLREEIQRSEQQTP